MTRVADASQSRSRIRRLLADVGHAPKKQYGQNFLTDPNIVRRIVALAEVDGQKVVEIGAGTGALTAVLAERAGHVLGFEIDAALRPILTDTVGHLGNVELRFEDAAGIDLASELDGGPWTLVSNLPYNVGTGIVLDALRHASQITRFVVMVQREVAERMLASSGSKVYGLPSVIVGLHAVGHVALTVPPHVFEPAPNVESAVVVLQRVDVEGDTERAIEIAASGFNQRRKMLRRSLRPVIDDVGAVLTAAGVDPTTRAEQLSPTDYVAIARAEGAQ